MRRGFILVLLAVLTTAARADFMAGYNAYNAGNMRTALGEWQKLAHGGDAASQYWLGRLYERGEGVLQDYVEAYKWYSLAAAGGEPPARGAMTALGARMSPQDVAAASAAARAFRPGAVPGPVATAPAPTAAPRSQWVEPKGPAAVPKPMPPAPATPPVPAPRPATPPPAAAAAKPASPEPVAPPAKVFDTVESCQFLLRYKDQGSGGLRDLALYEPVVQPGFLYLGAYAQYDYNAPIGCVTVVRPLGGKMPDGKEPFVQPAGYDMIWRDDGSGADMDGSIWQPRPPGSDYVCLGSVGQSGYVQPSGASYACVHRCLTRQVQPRPAVWTDEGTGARMQVAVFGVYGAGTVRAVTGRSAPASLDDFDPLGQCR